MSQIKTARTVTAKPENELLEEWVGDVMTHYVKTADPILKLGYSVAKRMVYERLHKICLNEDNKRRFLMDKGITKQSVGASPRASVPVKDAKKPQRQVIAKVSETELMDKLFN